MLLNLVKTISLNYSQAEVAVEFVSGSRRTRLLNSRSRKYIFRAELKKMKLIGYVVLFLVCLFVSILLVGILLPGKSYLAQGGKSALSFALALVLTAVAAKLINKMR